MKTLIILLIVLSANFATAGELEYDVSNLAWSGVVVSGAGSPKVYGYISRKWSKVRNNVVENPVVVTGAFYGKGMVLVTGTAENGTPVREVLIITSIHNPID